MSLKDNFKGPFELNEFFGLLDSSPFIVFVDFTVALAVSPTI